MGWHAYYGEIADWLESKGLHDGIMLEVGTAAGGLAEAILSRHPNIQYHAVDPFLGGYDTNDAMSQLYDQYSKEYGTTLADVSAAWARAMAYDLGGRFGDRYYLHHNKSTDAAPLLPRNLADVAMIDGLHTYEGVRDDINVVVPVMAPGSYLIFNDYGFAPHIFGVQPAADEFAKRWNSPLIPIGSPEFNNVAFYVPPAAVS